MTARGNIEIQVRRWNRIKNAFRPFFALRAQYFDADIYKWMQEQRARLKGTPYAPKRPGQRYARTGRMANSWNVQKYGVAHYAIKNSTPYAGYVVGDDQAWMHKGRWWQARRIVEGQMGTLRARLYVVFEDILS